MLRKIFLNSKLKFTQLKMAKIIESIEAGRNFIEAYKKISLKDTIIYTFWVEIL